jgi:DNA-binding CsgD family transcriptional regulator
MANIEIISPNFLNCEKKFHVSNKEKLKVKNYITKQAQGMTFGVNKSLEHLLIKLNSVKSYEEIPSHIQVLYSDLIYRNLDFKSTLDVINLTAKLAAARFDKKPKEILFTGYCGSGDNAALDNHYEKIVSAGFAGCAVSPMAYGVEAAEDHWNIGKKDPGYWNPLALSGKKIIVPKESPLEITLTFRQEQIFNMVCKGMTNYQIASRLSLSESTVKMHIGIVLKKYKVQHRSQLIASTK